MERSDSSVQARNDEEDELHDFAGETINVRCNRDEGLSGKRYIGEAMADYEKRRNGASASDYQRNIDFARFKPLPPETYQLRAALRGNQEDTNRFMMATEGMIPRDEFFNPQNVRRILAAAGYDVQARFSSPDTL